MDFNLGNHKGEIISKENFSVQKHIVDHRLSKTRIYLTSKLKSNNQLVKEIASTTISINSDDDDDFEIPSPLLQSNSINPNDFLNMSGSLSQMITSVPSLNQTSVAEYGSSYIEPSPDPVSVEQRCLPALGTLPLDNLRSTDFFNVVNNDTLIGTTSKQQILINEI